MEVFCELLNGGGRVSEIMLWLSFSRKYTKADQEGCRDGRTFAGIATALP